MLLRKTGFLPEFVIHSFMGAAIPQADGSILVGATRHEGEFDQEITGDAISELMTMAKSILPTLANARFVGAAAGVRPGSPDGIPIMGPIPEWEGLSMATGHDAVGVMLSPGTGQLMADYIRTGEVAPLQPFSLSRFTDL